VFLMENQIQEALLNVGVGVDISIRQLAEVVMETVGFSGKIQFDTDKPDGTPRKMLDVSKMTALGWVPRINLKQGIRGTYYNYLQLQNGSIDA